MYIYIYTRIHLYVLGASPTFQRDTHRHTDTHRNTEPQTLWCCKCLLFLGSLLWLPRSTLASTMQGSQLTQHMITCYCRCTLGIAKRGGTRSPGSLKPFFDRDGLRLRVTPFWSKSSGECRPATRTFDILSSKQQQLLWKTSRATCRCTSSFVRSSSAIANLQGHIL